MMACKNYGRVFTHLWKIKNLGGAAMLLHFLIATNLTLKMYKPFYHKKSSFSSMLCYSILIPEEHSH